jgi:hypothetical protein
MTQVDNEENRINLIKLKFNVNKIFTNTSNVEVILLKFHTDHNYIFTGLYCRKYKQVTVISVVTQKHSLINSLLLVFAIQ